ncbi:Alpha-1 3-mannosyl-glycoprotein beta-1 2-N-acetylglucosaminyltransferase, partial [Fasciolopsis buskii]
ASILKLTALICPFRFFASQLLICSRIQQQLQGRLKNALWHRTASFPLSRNFTLPILVIACNRLTVKRTLDSLLRYRSELVDLSPNQFPITVSHGCDHKPTRDILKSYKPAITVTEFLDDSSPSKFLGPVQKGYASAARHYKYALERMFVKFNHSALIIVEDDLDIASDFFQYFAATLPMLMASQSLFCVSAWNDNGRPGLVDPSRPDLLYRTDFFSGLGWMLLRQFWLEIREGWPDIFWDEYLRKPYVRKNRSCLRPEVSRTITFGRMGISKGQFFDAYLKTMILNNQWQNFLRMDLSYLHEPNYTRRWLDSVYNMSVEIPLSQFLKDDLPLILTTPARRIRVTYKSQIDFNQIAVKLNLMNDIKSGVMRNAFAGVVPVKWKNQWIYIAPPPTWTDYDQSWT